MASNKVAETKEIPEEIEKQLLSIELLDINDLFIDQSYQRDLDPPRVAKMAREWNWMACGNLTLSLRVGKDGKNQYAVIDGQQRLAAIRIAGYKEAPCRVYVDLTETQEAELFEILNSGKKPNYNNLFKSRLSRGEQKAKNINTATRAVGYVLDPERRHTSSPSSPGNHFYIQSMREMERIYDWGGSVLIMDALRLYKAVYEGEHVGNQAMFVSGFALFLKTYKTFNKTDLVEKLKRAGYNKILQTALQWAAIHRTSSVNLRGISLCEAMVVIYNQNRKEENRIKSKNL